MGVVTTKTRLPPWFDTLVGLQEAFLILVVATGTKPACRGLENGRVTGGVRIVTQGAVLTCRIVGHPALPVLSLFGVTYKA